MLSKLSRRTMLIAALVVAIASVSAVAVATAHKSHASANHHKHYGAAGWVTGNDGSTLTLRDGRARAHKFDENSNTKFVYQNGAAATSADAKPGVVVSVRATKPATTGGNPVAKRVVIHVARLAGGQKPGEARGRSGLHCEERVRPGGLHADHPRPGGVNPIP